MSTGLWQLCTAKGTKATTVLAIRMISFEVAP